MYIHANINRTQASKENYLLLSSLLVSLLWGLCRVRYSGWALLSTPRALETRLEMRNEERFLSFFRGKTHLVFLYNSPLDYISRTIEEKYLVPSSRIYSRRNSISGRRRIQQLKNFQLVSHPLLLCSDVCKTVTMIQALDRSFFSFEIVAPIADILKTRIEFESIIFHCDIPSPPPTKWTRYISGARGWTESSCIAGNYRQFLA